MRRSGEFSVADIRWSPQAIRDVESIWSFIAQDSPHYGNLIAQRLVAAVDRLETFPTSGRVVPEFGDEAIREVLWRNYRVVYRIAGDVVDIATVFHGSLPMSEKK